MKLWRNKTLSQISEASFIDGFKVEASSGTYGDYILRCQEEEWYNNRSTMKIK